MGGICLEPFRGYVAYLKICGIILQLLERGLVVPHCLGLEGRFQLVEMPPGIIYEVHRLGRAAVKRDETLLCQGLPGKTRPDEDVRDFSFRVGYDQVLVLDLLTAPLDSFRYRVPFRRSYRDVEGKTDFCPFDVQDSVKSCPAIGAFAFVAPFDSYFRHLWCANFCADLFRKCLIMCLRLCRRVIKD